MTGRIDQRTAPFAALLLRVTLGVVFVAHALLKWLVLSFPGAAAFFAEHGFPGWTVYPVFAVELCGGLALLLGIEIDGFRSSRITTRSISSSVRTGTSQRAHSSRSH